jgi:hypothetical protein
MLHYIKGAGANALVRLSASIIKTYERRLPDGSYLATFGKGRNCQHEALKVRVIEYQSTDPRFPGAGQTYRLMTTLLDEQAYPALELVALYHERWQEETTFEELDRHQQLFHAPLRNEKPLMVLQELYSILLAHWIIRALIHQAVTQPGQVPVSPVQVSYMQAVSLVHSSNLMSVLMPASRQEQLKRHFLDDLAHARLPSRRKTVRSYPRVRKTRMSKFPLKKAHHQGVASSDVTWDKLFSLCS